MILIPKYKNVIELQGSLSLVLTDTGSGKIRQELYVPNLVVTSGKNFIASRMIGTATNVMSHMALGLGATEESTVGRTSLVSELTQAGYARQAVTASANANIVTYSAVFPAQVPSAPTGGVALVEAGIFNTSTGGSGMLCRTVYPVVTKLPADALTITWQITIS